MTMPKSDANHRAPSGLQIELNFGNQAATVVEVGGALRTYTVDEHPLIEGYSRDASCSGARGQTFIPWPNRLRDGTYNHDGQDHQLPLSEPVKRNAIHGLVRWINWTVATRDKNRVVMIQSLFPQDGWPFMLDLSIEYELGHEGLSVRTKARNVGANTCPYGTGAHPYLTLDSSTIDRLFLRAPGSRRLQTDDRQIPTGSEAVAATMYDFRRSRPIGTLVLDTAYIDLERDKSGLAHVELTDPETTTTVRLWMDGTYKYLALFTGDSLATPNRRRRGLGVEPMTCAPNAFQSGEGLHLLDPGECFESTWGISPNAQEHHSNQ